MALTFTIGAQTACSWAFASPWTRDDGRLFLSTRLDYFAANSDDGGRFRRLETNSYAEYGLLRATAIGAKFVYGNSWTSDPNGLQAAYGVSEIEGFVQQQIWRGDRSVASVRLSAGSLARVNAGGRPDLASDGVDLELRALYGRILRTDGLKIFATAETGYRKRLGDSADQIRLDGLLGIEPSSRWLILIETFSTVSLRNQNPGGADYDIYKVQPSIIYRFARRLSAQAGVNHEFAGRNVARGDTAFIGLWSEF